MGEGERALQVRQRSARLPLSRLRQAAQRLAIPVEVLDELDNVDAVITLKSYYHSRPKLLVEAEENGIPLYVLRSNTVAQMQNCLAGILELSDDGEEGTLSQALRETQEAVHKVIGGAHMVELSPQNAQIRRQQHELVHSFDLISHSRGKEPRRRVRIYRE